MGIEADAGQWTLWVFLLIIAAVVQWWMIVYAVRRALQDHTIWKHTKWPAMKERIDRGEINEKGFPTSDVT
jgi:uncharacterized membrane protein